MPVTLKLDLLAGRYHATPWGRHVNEGVPEWPPSPWRLLRALVAVWRRTCPDLSEPQVRRILEPLLAPPCFRLPPFRVAHSRHYMPWEKKGLGDRTLIFDTFVAVGRTASPFSGGRRPQSPADSASLYVVWPGAELPADDLEALARLVGNLSFLGRAESWVRATLERESVAWNCEPVAPANPDPDPVSVLCPDPATAFGSEHYPSHDIKKLRKGLRADDLLFDCPRWHLCLDTQTLHDRRWPQMPGSLWMNYTRPAEEARSVTAARPRRPPATFARFALDGPVLPLVTETLPLAERMRTSLLKICEGALDPAERRRARAILPTIAPAFFGKDEEGRPMTGHRHAFFLPVDEDDDGHIDHIVVFARMGFSECELRAIDRLRHLRSHPRSGDDELDLRLALVGLGVREDFARSRLLGPSTVWESATPFLVTRHLKSRGQKRDPREWFGGPDGHAAFVCEMLREELERRDALEPGRFAGAELEMLPDHRIGPRRLRTYEFHLHRDKPKDHRSRRLQGALRIRFPHLVTGPVVLGHSCHFGLGLFLQPASVGLALR